MELLRMLHQLHPGAKIKIGAKNGTGYFYMGTVRDFLESKEVFRDMDHAYFEKRKKSAEKNFNTELYRDVSVSAFVRKEFQKDKIAGERPIFTQAAYEQFVANYLKCLSKKYQKLLKERQIFITHVPLLNRTVVEDFNADQSVDDNTMAIIIEGHEMGAYWMFSEAKSLPTMKFSFVAPDEEEEGQ